MRLNGFVALYLVAALFGQAQTFDSSVRPFVNKSCLPCHNSKLHSGELDLQKHTAPGMELKDRDIWEAVVRRVRAGEMPPTGLPRPKPAEIDLAAGFIEKEYDRRDRAAPPDPGRVTARRLNRAEYNNTIRDLFGIDFRPAEDFPSDDSGYGFDNIGDVLSLSPVLLEKYLAAAESITRRAILAEQPKFRSTRNLLKAETLPKPAPLQEGQAGPAPGPEALHYSYAFPAEADYEIRVTLGGIRPIAPNGTDPLPVTLAFWLDGDLQRAWTVNPKTGQPRNFEFRRHITAGEHTLSAAFVNDGFVSLTNPITARDRYLTVDLFELRGPFNPVPQPLPISHKKLVSCGHEPGQDHNASCPRTILSGFVRRAFRRPIEASEVDRLVKLMDSARKDGETVEGAIRIAMQAVLVSPHFLFRVERGDGPVNDFALATRLSYFLWSSTPDDELLDLAGKGQLRQDLKAQIRRMMADPKSAALAENFAGQWLQLRNLAEVKPDPDRFPRFDTELRSSMQRETELFFESVVREDRSVLDFLDGKWTWLNARLAEHYGIPGIQGSEFRKVALSGTQRSGVLTQASILTVSSYPTRTSPVIRGKWVLENLLNTPPPPPPPDVPTLDEGAVGNKGSLRQQMEKHRANSVCASCHAKMDPLGFGLENYDAIGAWRTRDGKFAIDTSGVLPSGKSFRGSAELKSILRSDREVFTKCLTEKLLTYALGRGLDRTDRPAVQSINRRLADGGFRFSALVEGIAESLPFQNRRAEVTQ